MEDVAEDAVGLAEVVAAMAEVMGEVVMTEEATIVATVHLEEVIAVDTEEGQGAMHHTKVSQSIQRDRYMVRCEL